MGQTVFQKMIYPGKFKSSFAPHLTLLDLLFFARLYPILKYSKSAVVELEANVYILHNVLRDCQVLIWMLTVACCPKEKPSNIFGGIDPIYPFLPSLF